jgi:HlyD family secretion protein
MPMRNSWKVLRMTAKWLAALGLLLAVGFIAAFSFRGGDQIRYLTAKVQRGDIRDEVEATGIVNSVVTVQVGSQVSGTIAKLNADFNSRVRRGDVVALIDPALFEGALQQAAADLQNAKANVAAVEANLEKAKATLVQTEADYKRQSALVQSGAQSQQVAELAKANFDVAKSSVTAAQAAIEQAKAQVKQKEAGVTVANTNLAYTTIRSPIDGIVVARNVDVGQTVAASLQAPTIFNIAQDLTKMQLYAKTDESDVGRIKLGQDVTFKVDAFPKDVFHGTVTQKRMNATTVQNVVTYDTIIDFNNGDLKLFPGMTAYVTIPVATAEKSLKVPNTALRFRPALPPVDLRALYAKYGIDDVSQAVPQAGDEASAGRTPRRETAIVWKLGANKLLEPAQIETGITDHAYTEVAAVIKGDLKVDDNVVTASVESKSPQAPR